MTASHASPQCPQCGGSLPRQALWRAVSCSYCKAVVTLNTRWVERAGFRAAWQRTQARPEPSHAAEWLTLQGHDYRLLGLLGQGERADVWLAERHGSARLRAVLKLQRGSGDALGAEAETLQQLHAQQAADSAYFSLRLPQVLAVGVARGTAHERTALAMHAWPGFTASLADVMDTHPTGLADSRHAVWLWRRVLEVLAYLHRQGWCHRDLRAEHWLLHPGDHGVHLVGWGAARRQADPAIDLQQSAWTLRAALAGLNDQPPELRANCPPALAALLNRASEDRDWCRAQGADGLAQQLTAAALAAFGPPRFVPFDALRA